MADIQLTEWKILIFHLSY